MKIENLLKLLNDRRVDYVIIGAHAMAAHGFVRTTGDIDILIEPTAANIARVRSALESFGFDTEGASETDFQMKKILFRQYWLDTDIHPSASGVRTTSVLNNKIRGKYEGVDAFFASLEDMIKMKKAAGRPKDIEDLVHLKEIRRQKKTRKKS